MTEWSTPFTNGLTDGGPVSAASMWRVFRMLLGPAAEEADKGVIRSWDNELAATSPGADEIDIDTGAAFCHGAAYENTASLTLTADRPSTGTTGKRVVLRKDIVNGGVRATVISSADGTATLPSLTQSESTYWDIPICSFTHATNGTIGALTDEREFLVIGGGMKRAIGTEILLPTGPSVGTTAATGGSANAFGSWVEFSAATSTDLLITGVNVARSAADASLTYVQVEIGVGAGAAEVVKARTRPTGQPRGNQGNLIGGDTVFHFSYPLFVAAGSRVAVRVADSLASSLNHEITLIALDPANLEVF